jgi:Mg-chelatase subunit ChlD/uncharacterized membrane protein
VIGLSVLHPEFLALLLLAPLAYLAWRRWPPPLSRTRSRLALGSRLLMIVLLALALAGVRLDTAPARRAIVAVVDVSASVKAHGNLEQESEIVRRLAASKGPDDLFGVVTFGHDASVELPLTRTPQFDGFQTQPDPSYTDIAGALQLAAGMLPDGYAHQLVLISDGRQNLGDAISAVAALRAEGDRVDVIPVGQAPSAEAMVTAVDAPSSLREGQTATITVHLQSTGEAAGRLTLIVDDQEVASRSVSLPAGSSSQVFQVPGLAIGLHQVQAELTVQPDTYTENNVGEAVVRVLGRPSILLLEGKPGEGANVAAALQAAGMQVDERPAAGAPTDTATLGRYDSTVIVDAPADSFPSSSMAAIAAAVHDLGRGLVTIGGPTSYGPGGWQGTALEQALPVSMDIPNRKNKPKVAVVLVMETMEDPQADQVALGAAEDVIAQLSPNDLVGVTDGRQGFVVPMTSAADKKSIDQKLQSATLGDPPGYLSFLQMAFNALQQTDAPVKHIVVLGDGDANSDPPQAVQSFLQQALAKGVTTSAVGVNVHGVAQYMSYMQDIARWGGGRFYESDDPSQVPQLFLRESVASLRPWFEQEPFFPKIGSPGDLLQGVPTGSFPQLGGYVVTTPKPAADQYLISPKQDPVLAAWNYGLGRSVAWTSDATGTWTAGFLSSPVSGVLFARMVAWTLPTTAQQLQVQARPSGDGLQVDVTGPQVPGATVQVGVERPDLQGSNLDLVQVAPGHWQGRISGTTVGIYLLHGALSKNGQVMDQGDAAIAVPYSPEYLQLGRDDGFLRQIARAGAGTVLARPELAWEQPPLPIPVSTDVFWPLILIAVLLWPLDVALRRITLGPRQILDNALALARRRRAPDLEVAVPEELVRLRERVSRARRRPAAVPPPVTSSGPRSPGPPPEEARPRARPGPAPPGAEPRTGTRAAPGRGDRRAPPKRDEEALSARLLEARRRRRGTDR